MVHNRQMPGAYAHSPLSALPRLEPCMLDHPPGEGVNRDMSRHNPGRTMGSFDYAHVLSHMGETGEAGISPLQSLYRYFTMVGRTQRPTAWSTDLHLRPEVYNTGSYPSKAAT
jgi:hypothetical protein